MSSGASLALVQGHAGTVPMSLRVDALAAAAEAVAMIERRCGGGRINSTEPRGSPRANHSKWSPCVQRTQQSVGPCVSCCNRGVT